MMGRLKSEQVQLFYHFNLEDALPDDHLVRQASLPCPATFVRGLPCVGVASSSAAPIPGSATRAGVWKCPGADLPRCNKSMLNTVAILPAVVRASGTRQSMGFEPVRRDRRPERRSQLAKNLDAKICKCSDFGRRMLA